MSDGAHFSRLGARLASLALCLFALGLGAAPAAAAAPATGKLTLSKSARHPEILVMNWQGTIGPGMADQINNAFERYKGTFTTIEFVINSGGGSVKEGERVIQVMKKIKKTHHLYTGVLAGKLCGSMCVFVYVQGEKRYAAPSSVWLFHEVSYTDKSHKIVKLDRQQWEGLVDKYWVPAGVSQTWIDNMKEHTFQTDYFQSGQNLLEDESGIVHKALSDEHRRRVYPQTAHQS